MECVEHPQAQADAIDVLEAIQTYWAEILGVTSYPLPSWWGDFLVLAKHLQKHNILFTQGWLEAFVELCETGASQATIDGWVDVAESQLQVLCDDTELDLQIQCLATSVLVGTNWCPFVSGDWVGIDYPYDN